jgi:glycine cleavage system transcriptional repressor
LQPVFHSDRSGKTGQAIQPDAIFQEQIFMTNKAIISVLGPDRPGILAAVSQLIAELDCNIENARQTILQGEFAGIFIASIPEALKLAEINNRMQEAVRPMGLTVHVKDMTPSPFSCGCDCEPFVITAQGPDRKGLVAGITRILARYSVNVTNLQAVFSGGEDPEGNVMIYEVDIPVSLDSRALCADLRSGALDLGLSISIQHRNIFKAINRI